MTNQSVVSLILLIVLFAVGCATTTNSTSNRYNDTDHKPTSLEEDEEQKATLLLQMTMIFGVYEAGAKSLPRTQERQLSNEVGKIRDAYASYRRGLDRKRIGLWAQAISDYNEAISYYNALEQKLKESKMVGMGRDVVYYSRAIAYYHTGQYNKAWEDVQKVQAHGLSVYPGFLKTLQALREASGTQR